MLASLREGDDYLDATIKEILRVRPVITDVSRLTTREIELGGVKIPAGARVMPSISAIHYRPDLYPEPYAFRPERFLDPRRHLHLDPFRGRGAPLHRSGVRPVRDAGDPPRGTGAGPPALVA